MDAAKYYQQLQARHKPTSTATSVASVKANTPSLSPVIIINAVIEHVRDGASFRCYVPQDSCYVTFALAGATCPRVNNGTTTSSSSSSDKNATSGNGSGGNAAEPFAIQSKLFTEMRLLNRRLDLVR
jgi:hypothetical protein